MNLILEQTDQVPYFTEMGAVFRALKISAREYDWYLSDIETNHIPAGFATDDQWMSGETLHTLITEHELQFIWGVFRAVPKGFRCSIESPPYADMNSTFWGNPDCRPQLEGALFEIVCWDSGATILIGISAEAATYFSQAFPDAKRLSEASGPSENG